MIKRIEKDVPLYEKFGIFTEAPRKKRRKPRVVSVSPKSRRHDYLDDMEADEEIDINSIDDDEFSDYSDFSDDELNEIDSLGTDEPAPENPQPEEPVDNPEPADDTIDVSAEPDQDDDYTQDIEDPNQTDPQATPEEPAEPAPEEPAAPEPPAEEPAPTTDTPEATPEQPQTDATGGDPNATPTEEPPAEPAPAETPAETPADTNAEAPATDSNDPLAPIDDPNVEPSEGSADATGSVNVDPNDSGADDTEDYTADADPADPNAGGDAADPNDPNAAPADPNADKPVTKDDVKKFMLYKKFMDLYEMIDYFIVKTEPIIVDDKAFSCALNATLANFRKLEKLVKDYMILKFKTDSYLQNVFFYEKTKANVTLNLELLENNNNSEKQLNK